MYVSTKNYGPESGFTIAYRQWKDFGGSCSQIHGYSVMFYIEMECEDLDTRNWCADFGSYVSLRDFLKEHFDHTFLCAYDDPFKEKFVELHKLGVLKLVEVEATGCEKLAKMLYDHINDTWIPDNGYGDRVHCRLVRVSETASNSAWYECHSAEHDEQMKEEVSRLNFQPIDQITNLVDHVREMLSYVKRIKLKRNKPTAFNEFKFYCTRVAPHASSPEAVQQILQLKESI